MTIQPARPQLGYAVRVPIETEAPDNFREQMADYLEAFVPLRIYELRSKSPEEIDKLRAEAVTLITAKGDVLQYGGKGQTEARVALITAIAVLAFSEGGVTALGVHACAEPHEGCRR